MPLQATSGAASYDAFGGGVPVVPNYIEDVYSTYVYTGVSGSNVTINNGINLSVNGGLIWSKGRNGANPNSLTDTVRGVANALNSASIFASGSSGISSFTTTGYVTNQAGSTNGSSSETYVSWTLRKQPKFFDIVTWTGSGANRTISHNLGSVPACIMVKCLDDDLAWAVYHRSLANTEYLVLNSTAAKATGATWWNSTTPTSTVFSLGTDTTVNGSAKTYVAYIFAHNAGGFGLTGTDNVISCGSFTTDGPGNATVSLGYEPQWLLTKGTSAGNDWFINDNMRGLSYSTFAFLNPNYSDAETVLSGDYLVPNATGFTAKGFSGSTTFIYIAIRRGPMKVPTVGTTVYNGITRTGTTGAVTVTGVGFTPDLGIGFGRSEGIGTAWYDRLRGKELALRSAITNAEYSSAPGGEGTMTTTMDGMIVERTYGILNSTSTPYINWFFKRAPGFFDEVCVTPSYPTPVTHNLGAVPKLRFEKTRSITAEWKAIYFDGTTDEYELALNSTRAASLQSGRPALPTSTSFVAYYDGTPLVIYLFAPVTGVQYISKFTGNGSSQTINCGFTGGARFICIKAFSTTGDWKVIDTARGIVSGNDPTLALNTTSAEVTGTDCIDPDSSGFIVNQESTNNLNVNGVEYLVWAIA